MGSAARAERAIALQHPDKRVALHDAASCAPSSPSSSRGRPRQSRQAPPRAQTPNQPDEGIGRRTAWRGRGRDGREGGGGAGESAWWARLRVVHIWAVSHRYLFLVGHGWYLGCLSAVSRLSLGCLPAVSRLRVSPRLLALRVGRHASPPVGALAEHLAVRVEDSRLRGRGVGLHAQSANVRLVAPV